MGAATAICYDEKPPLPIAGLILDSCFADFKDIPLMMLQKFGMGMEILA
jgi:hypothetical protein